MFCNARANYRINKLHEGAVRFVCDDYKTFSELLAKDVSFTVHH